MVRKKVKITIPQYRERKEIFEALGYKEVSYREKGIYSYVELEIDENEPHYAELMSFERGLYRRGPTFLPIIILVILAFALLSVFVIRLAQARGGEFDLIVNALSFLLPAFTLLLLDVIYTYFYYSVNKKILDRGVPNKQAILESIEEIKKR